MACARSLTGALAADSDHAPGDSSRSLTCLCALSPPSRTTHVSLDRAEGDIPGSLPRHPRQASATPGLRAHVSWGCPVSSIGDTASASGVGLASAPITSWMLTCRVVFKCDSPFFGADVSHHVSSAVVDSSWFTLFQRLTPDTARRCESIVPQACGRPALCEDAERGNDFCWRRKLPCAAFRNQLLL